MAQLYNNPVIRPAQSAAGQAVLIVNTRARRGQELYNQAQIALRHAGINLIGSYAVTSGRQLPELARNIVKGGIKSLIVGGGDGTISAIVDYLVNHEINLGVLPLGTGNDFAATMNIPSTLEAAARVIAAGRTSRIDLGIVNHNYYVNVASVGFGAAVTTQITDADKRNYGSFAYTIAAARTALTHRPFVARLTFSNQTITTPAINIAVANGRFYGGGNLVTPDARIDDNELIVTLFEPMNLTELIQVGSQLRSGLYTHHPRVRVFRRVRHLQLEIIEGLQQHLNVDGELWGHTPATFGIAPASLSVFVP